MNENTIMSLANSARTTQEPTFTLTLTAQQALTLYCIAGCSPPAGLERAYRQMVDRLREETKDGRRPRVESSVLDYLTVPVDNAYPAASVHSKVLYTPLERWLKGLRLEPVPQPEPPKRLVHRDGLQDRR